MALSRYTLRQLEAFTSVADALSFTVAADRLGLTPSAVSQLVLEFEAATGFKLFDRSTRHVALSSAGRDFLGSAESVLHHLRLAEVAAADVRDRAAGLVRVAAPMVIASAILPAAIRRYTQSRPKIVVRIRDAAVERLVDLVAQGDVDFAIGPDRPTGDDVQRSSVFESPWVLWCASDHPLARKRLLRWSDLRGQPLVTAGRDHERSVAQMRLNLPEDERIVPIDVVDNVSTALGIAAEGLAATLSPAYVGLWAERRWGLVKRRVIEPEVMRQVCLYRPTRRVTSPAAEGFAEALSDWLRNGPPRKVAPEPRRRASAGAKT